MLGGSDNPGAPTIAVDGRTASVAASGDYARAIPLRARTERLRLVLLWMVGFSGGFVFVEPAPYEVLTLFAFLVFAADRLIIRAAHLPLIVLLILYCIGLSVGVIPV